MFLFHGRISTSYSNIIVILRLYRKLSEDSKHLFFVTNFSVLDSIHIKSLYKWKSCDVFLVECWPFNGGETIFKQDLLSESFYLLESYLSLSYSWLQLMIN